MLANQSVDDDRLRALVDSGARITVAVDSETTIHAAVRAGIGEVLIDVNVGMPRCGVPADGRFGPTRHPLWRLPL